MQIEEKIAMIGRKTMGFASTGLQTLTWLKRHLKRWYFVIHVTVLPSGLELTWDGAAGRSPGLAGWPPPGHGWA
jgi:hypothetical protein